MKSCVVPACFRLAARVMDPSFPPVLSCLRAAIPLSVLHVDLAVMWRDACCGARGVLAVSVAFVGTFQVTCCRGCFVHATFLPFFLTAAPKSGFR